MECVICPYCCGVIWSVLYVPIVVEYVEFFINIIYKISVVYGVLYMPLL